MDITTLNEERKKRKITVAELAARANLPKGTVEKILFGIVKNPRLDTVQALEKALEKDEDTVEINKISVNALQKELLTLFNEIGEKFGKEKQLFVIEMEKTILQMKKDN